MRAPIALALLVFLVGCADEFTPASTVNKLRVLGIRSEPAELRPGEAATVSALVMDPSRPGKANTLVWFACDPDPLNLGRSACSDLGELGDERAIPLLTALLDDPRLAELRSPAAGSVVAQTVGDGAFLALLKLLGFEPAKFGMTQTQGEGGIRGFSDDATRQAARQHLRQWMAENLNKPRSERAPLAPLPAPRPRRLG